MSISRSICRRNKANTFSLSLIACLIITVSVAGVTTPSTTNSIPTVSTMAGESALHQQIRSAVTTMNMEKAISLAASSSAFQSLSLGHAIQFNSIFTSWSDASRNDPTNLGLENVNVVYSYRNADGTSANIVAKLDASLSSVLSVSIQQSPQFNGSSPNCCPCCQCLGSVVPATNQVASNQKKITPDCGGGGGGSSCYSDTTSISWSGYEFRTACAPQSNPVYEATSTWTVPSVSEPYSHACDFHHCDIAVWDGLSHDAGGGSPSSGYIVQAGTDSGVFCAFGGCSNFYSSWYMFLGQSVAGSQPSSVSCGAINAGDVIKTDVVNEAVNGGSSSYWDIYVEDFGQGGTGSDHVLCAIVQYGFGVATPYYAQFIAETPYQKDSTGAYFTRLPKFSTFSMTADMNQKNSATKISGATAYANTWLEQYIMYNCDSSGACYYNIGASFDYSSNSLTQTWITSSAT
jgi:hypothetical protein